MHIKIVLRMYSTRLFTSLVCQSDAMRPFSKSHQSSDMWVQCHQSLPFLFGSRVTVVLFIKTRPSFWLTHNSAHRCYERQTRDISKFRILILLLAQMRTRHYSIPTSKQNEAKPQHFLADRSDVISKILSEFNAILSQRITFFVQANWLRFCCREFAFCSSEFCCDLFAENRNYRKYCGKSQHFFLN